MALISTVIVIVSQFALKIFIKVFGWALVIYFGKIPEEKSRLMSAIALLSLIWMGLIISIIYPNIMRTFYNYIPDATIKAIVAKVFETLGIIVIPIIVGELSFRMSSKKDRTILSYVLAAIRGFVYSVKMGTAMIIMLVSAPFIKVFKLAKRLKTVNMAVDIEKGESSKIIKNIARELQENGIKADIVKPSFLFRLPILILKKMIIELLDVEPAAQNIISGEDYKIYVNSTDIMIESHKNIIQRIMIIIDAAFVFEKSSLTWDDVSNNIKFKAQDVYNDYKMGNITGEKAADILDEIMAELENSDVQYEGWRTVKRYILGYQNEILKKLKNF